MGHGVDLAIENQHSYGVSLGTRPEPHLPFVPESKIGTFSLP